METEARSDLVARNLGFVRKTAEAIHADKVRKSSMILDFNSDDLFQAGCIALWKSAETFDPDRGCTFLTYAGHAMRNAMLDLCREASSRAENKLASNGWEIVSLNESAKEDEDPPHTLRETARHFHLSANRAERLEKNALRQLREGLWEK